MSLFRIVSDCTLLRVTLISLVKTFKGNEKQHLILKSKSGAIFLIFCEMQALLDNP